jgi:hypothetical protein
MDDQFLDLLISIRATVGYLGEKDQFAWWPSAFFGPSSNSFLAPVFARTQMLAQCAGVTRAAASVHDERIGVGRVYHLFRLPEDMEQTIHSALQTPALCQNLDNHVANKDAALAFLRQTAAPLRKPGVGPTLVGGLVDLRNLEHWRLVAAHYLHAFERGAEVFAYFADHT